MINRREFLIKSCKTLAGVGAIAAASQVPRVAEQITATLEVTELEPGFITSPEITEADIMEWLVANEYTTRETKEPFQRMNQAMYNTPEGLRITYVWDQEPGFNWDKDIDGGRRGWHFLTEKTASGYQLRISGHQMTAIVDEETLCL